MEAGGLAMPVREARSPVGDEAVSPGLGVVAVRPRV